MPTVWLHPPACNTRTHRDVRVWSGAAGPFPFYGGAGRNKTKERLKAIKILSISMKLR